MTGVDLSVVIPCFNYERYVGAAIESVVDGTRAPDEIIVVDDGSSDGSVAVVEKHEGVRLVRKPNGGMASALNRGIAEATGEVVVLLDADDLAAPGRLEWIAEAFTDPEVAMAWHPLTVVDEGGNERGTLPSGPLPDGDLVPGMVAPGPLTFAVTSGVAIRRSVLEAIGPVPEDDFRNFAESYLVRSAPFHGRVAASSRPLGTYRVHSASDMRRDAAVEPDAMAAQLATRIRMADTEQRHLCRMAEQAGHRLTPADIHAHDPVYRHLFVAHARLSTSGRAAAWRAGRELDLDGAAPSVRARASADLLLVTALPRGLVARHELVRSGSGGHSGLMRVWAVVYWRSKGLLRRG